MTTTRLIGKCKTKGCGQVIARDDVRRVRRSAGCPNCDRIIVLEPVLGGRSTKKCDARCVNAKGYLCDCSCNGTNHGAGWL